MVFIQYDIKCSLCGLTLGFITGKSDYSYHLKCLGCDITWSHEISIFDEWMKYRELECDNDLFEFIKNLYETN